MLNNLGGRVTVGKGLSKVNDGELPRQHSIEEIFGKSSMVDIDRPARDRTINDEIEGCPLMRDTHRKQDNQTVAVQDPRQKGIRLSTTHG